MDANLSAGLNALVLLLNSSNSLANLATFLWAFIVSVASAPNEIANLWASFFASTSACFNVPTLVAVLFTFSDWSRNEATTDLPPIPFSVPAKSLKFLFDVLTRGSMSLNASCIPNNTPSAKFFIWSLGIDTPNCFSAFVTKSIFFELFARDVPTSF